MAPVKTCKTPEEIYTIAVRKFLLMKQKIDFQNTGSATPAPEARTLIQRARISRRADHVNSLRPADMTDSESQSVYIKEMGRLTNQRQQQLEKEHLAKHHISN